MELIIIALVLIILFWGMFRNLRKAGDVVTSGLVASAAKYTATTAKELTPEDIAILKSVRELQNL